MSCLKTLAWAELAEGYLNRHQAPLKAKYIHLWVASL